MVGSPHYAALGGAFCSLAALRPVDPSHARAVPGVDCCTMQRSEVVCSPAALGPVDPRDAGATRSGRLHHAASGSVGRATKLSNRRPVFMVLFPRQSCPDAISSCLSRTPTWCRLTSKAASSEPVSLLGSREHCSDVASQVQATRHASAHQSFTDCERRLSQMTPSNLRVYVYIDRM